MRFGFTVNVTLWLSSSGAGGEAGPPLMAVAQLGTLWAGASSRTVWSAPLVKLGASLTAVAVMVNVCGALVSTSPGLAVPPLSMATMVTVAMPLALGARV